MRYTLDHLGERPSLERAARTARMSTRTLERRFEIEAGMSWRAFVQTARNHRAMDLLRDPGRAVTEIAGEVGFSSPGAFSHAFTRVVGQTPVAFRKAARGRKYIV
jgi:transcriptional regulator GlxA family with amidase domain